MKPCYIYIYIYTYQHACTCMYIHTTQMPNSSNREIQRVVCLAGLHSDRFGAEQSRQIQVLPSSPRFGNAYRYRNRGMREQEFDLSWTNGHRMTWNQKWWFCSGVSCTVQTGNVKQQKLWCQSRSQSLPMVLSPTMIVKCSLVTWGCTDRFQEDDSLLIQAPSGNDCYIAILKMTIGSGLVMTAT